jgi:two-component system response regulator AtoC
VSSGKEAIAKISAGQRPDFIILDVLMPDMGGLDTLKELMHLDRTLNVVMLSCSNEVGTVVEAIRMGAHDYLTKPFEKTELDAAMLKSRQKKQLTQENQSLRDYCDQVTEDLSFLAASPQMVRIRQQILQIAPVDVPVFICGESGVGKEVVARMIHLRSKRRNQGFIKVNCAALPGELLESELFGFEQGAFTGAVRAKPGKFEIANKGTIFLDEIAEMSTHLQAKLLHVLQDHQYSRLGGRHLVDTDVRVLAATNVDVHEAMKTGRFREDLYYRLNVLSINVPPLRERTAEIPLLFRHFLVKYSEKFGKTPPAPSTHLLDAAINYPWPGNLRELENFVKRYVILEDDEGSLRELIEMSSTRQRTSPREEPRAPRELGLKALVRGLKDEAEMEAIAEALEKTRWCRKDAAKMLGISYKALLYKMRQFNLDTPRVRKTAVPAAAPAEAEAPAPVSVRNG